MTFRVACDRCVDCVEKETLTSAIRLARWHRRSCSDHIIGIYQGETLVWGEDVSTYCVAEQVREYAGADDPL